MLKKICFILALLFVGQYASAQRVKIEHALEQLGDGYNSAFRISIPHATMKSVEKKWNSFIKSNDGKVRSSKGIIKGENLIINGISPDTIMLFSKLLEDADGIMLKVAFRKKGVFVSPESDASYNSRLEQILMDFAFELSREGLNEKLEVATKLLKDSQEEQADLEKSNERLASDNESMKKQISENEATIEENKSKIEELKQKVKGQQGSLDILRGKFGELK